MSKSTLLLFIVVTTMACGKVPPVSEMNLDNCVYKSHENATWPDLSMRISDVYSCQTYQNGACMKYVSGPEVFYKCGGK